MNLLHRTGLLEPEGQECRDGAPFQALADQLTSIKSHLLSKSLIEKLESGRCATLVFYIDGGELKRYHVYPSQILSLIFDEIL